MKREYQHKGIKIVTETKQPTDQAWMCDARVFLTTGGVDVPTLEGFDTEQEAEADSLDEAKRLIDLLAPRGQNVK